MTNSPEFPPDRLWHEYSQVFHEFDDLTLARWLAQTLGQFQGRAWRMSHPLVSAYRLAAHVANVRQIWFKRLATTPVAYSESPCCRAPLLPLFTRDVLDSGLVCLHCSNTAIPFDELPGELQPVIKKWVEEYAAIHAVAHWEDRQRKAVKSYDQTYEEAARSAERLLAQAGRELLPKLVEIYPAVVWEDHDECLEVRPEDVEV